MTDTSTDILAQPDLFAGIDTPRVLVIDDDTIHRMILLKIVAKTGYAADEAATAEAASEYIATRNYACIVLDLKLGAHSGIELLTQMNQQKCRTPVIMVTSAGEAARDAVMRLARLYALNISELPKPVDLAALRKRLTLLRPALAP